MPDRAEGSAGFDRIRLRARMPRHRRWRAWLVDPAVYYEDLVDRQEAHCTLRQLLQAIDPEAGHDAERIELVVRSGARVTRGQEQRLVARDGRGFLQLTRDSESRWGRGHLALLAAGRPAWDLQFLFAAGGDRLLVPWSVGRGLSDADPGEQRCGAGVRRDELEALGALVVARQAEAAVRGPARHEVELGGLGPVVIEARDGGPVSVLQLSQQSVELTRRPAAARARYRGTFAAGTLRMQLQRRSGGTWWCRCAEVQDTGAAVDVVPRREASAVPRSYDDALRPAMVTVGGSSSCPGASGGDLRLRWSTRFVSSVCQRGLSAGLVSWNCRLGLSPGTVD